MSRETSRVHSIVRSGMLCKDRGSLNLLYLHKKICYSNTQMNVNHTQGLCKPSMKGLKA
jgi:hypothetical protein